MGSIPTSSCENGLVPTQAEVTVLLSGGIDSAAVAALLLQSGHAVDALFVEYGQPAVSMERSASRAIADHYLLRWQSATCGPAPHPWPAGRNDLLVAVAQRTIGARSVAIGIHAGAIYPDCSPQWAAAWQALLDVQHGGIVQLMHPLAEFDKGEVYALAQELTVPIELTYSCDADQGPCGQCASCLDRRWGHIDV